MPEVSGDRHNSASLFSFSAFACLLLVCLLCLRYVSGCCCCLFFLSWNRGQQDKKFDDDKTREPTSSAGKTFSFLFFADQDSPRATATSPPSSSEFAALSPRAIPSPSRRNGDRSSTRRPHRLRGAKRKTTTTSSSSRAPRPGGAGGGAPTGIPARRSSVRATLLEGRSCRRRRIKLDLATRCIACAVARRTTKRDDDDTGGGRFEGSGPGAKRPKIVPFSTTRCRLSCRREQALREAKASNNKNGAALSAIAEIRAELASLSGHPMHRVHMQDLSKQLHSCWNRYCGRLHSQKAPSFSPKVRAGGWRRRHRRLLRRRRIATRKSFRILRNNSRHNGAVVSDDGRGVDGGIGNGALRALTATRATMTTQDAGLRIPPCGGYSPPPASAGQQRPDSVGGAEDSVVPLKPKKWRLEETRILLKPTARHRGRGNFLVMSFSSPAPMPSSTRIRQEVRPDSPSLSEPRTRIRPCFDSSGENVRSKQSTLSLSVSAFRPSRDHLYETGSRIVRHTILRSPRRNFPRHLS